MAPVRGSLASATARSRAAAASSTRSSGASAAPGRIGIVSLGCPKALVDSERILTRLRAEGYVIGRSYAEADVVLVNTCGFLDSARAESLAAIGEALDENGRVIVTGCLGMDPEVVRAAHPKVLAITGAGPDQYGAVMAAIHAVLPPPHDPYTSLVPPQGLRLTPRHYAYLKIAEGCDHACSFCIIPRLRGPQISRPLDEVMAEADRLVAAGVQELIVISQDSSAYGRDLGYLPRPWRGAEHPSRLVDLCAALGDLGVWVRLHYVYPTPEVDALVDLMAERRILPYLDMPFQHASLPVLRAMRRPAAADRTLERIAAWRARCPDLTLRSTFIVGFPGETEADFQILLDWLQDARLDRVGCFPFEPVAGAAANALPDPVPEPLRQERWQRLMAAQQAISAARMAEKIGRTLEVLIDEVDDDGAIGRSAADAPEIDGAVFLNGDTGVAPGDRVLVQIDEGEDYDLWGHRVG